MPDPGLSYYRHWFREVLCYFFSTTTELARLKKGYPKTSVYRRSCSLSIFFLSLANGQLPQNFHFGFTGVKAEPKLYRPHTSSFCVFWGKTYIFFSILSSTKAQTDLQGITQLCIPGQYGCPCLSTHSYLCIRVVWHRSHPAQTSL